jgi:CheY-like chemotaxis protein
VLKEALRLLRSTLPATIEIEQDFAPVLPDVLADPTQIHQVVMNLSTNAAQAMRNNQGRLVVELDLFQLAEGAPSPHPELRSGNYVRLIVKDTGYGMDQAILQRIFEPFFTTKKPGEGTGLGLAVVHGIVKDHDGVITATSQPGQGTTFVVYLPAVKPAEESEAEPLADVPRGRGEKILFVDDEAALCEVAQRVMTRLGYEPIVFRKSSEAWKAVHEAPGQFAAVVSDLTMPGMTGLELARRILSLRPSTPVILTSGFSNGLTEESARELGIRALIQKPLDYKALAYAVDAALRGPEKTAATY